MNLGRKSVMPQFGEGGAEGSKTQSLPLFKPIDRKSNVLHHIIKINPPSPLGGKVWGIPPFLTSKMCCSFLTFPPNWARKLKLSMYT